ncbi:MAG: protein kinase [Polyangiales bacterium]
MSEELAPGTSLPGGYTIEAPLDAGRITTRYRARSADGAAACAHVVHLALSDLMGEWFTQTAILHRGLEHPVLPRTHAVGELDGPRPVEVTELLLGRPARAYLNASPDGLDPRWVAGVIAEIASALDYLHEQRPPLLHRALSPERVLILDDTREVRLLGVGVADRPQFPAVRPSYQSPEELAGITGLTARADVFGLATLAWELLTGRPAFTGVGGAVLDAMRVGVHDRVSVLRPAVPASVDVVLRDAWALSPDQRPRTAGRFAELFAAAVAEGAQEPVSPQVAGMFDDRPTAETPVLILSGRSQTLIGAGVAAVRATANEPAEASAPATTEAPPPDVPPREEPPPESPADAAPLTTASPPASAPEGAPVGPDPSENVTEVVPKRAVADLEKTAPLTPLPSASDAAKSHAVSPRSARPAPVGGRLARGRSTPALHIPSPEEVAAAPAPVNTSLDAAERTTPLGAPIAPSEDAPATSATSDAKLQRPSVPSIVVAPEAEQPSRQPAPASPPIAPAPSQPAPSQPAPQSSAPVPSQPAPSAPDPFAAPPYAPAPQHVAPSAPPLGAGLASEFGAHERSTLPLLDDPPAPEKRASFPLGAALIANAILLVGIAHAIAWGVSSRQPPQTVTVTQPAPTCAPCAACPAPTAVAAPEIEEPAPPARRATTASRANPTPAAPTVQRLQPVGRSQSARSPRRSRIIVNPPSF